MADMNRQARKLTHLSFVLGWAIILFPSSLSAGGEISGCPIFPADNIWNVPVDKLPLDPRSDDYVSSIGREEPAHADFGSGIWPPQTGGPIGIPFITVAGDAPRVPVTFKYDQESDAGPYPIPADAPIEGGPNASGDRHVLVLDRDNCILYEVFKAFPENGASRWRGDSGAVFDLRSNGLRPDTWTSADAAGLPILPGLVRFEEVASGEITHALRFTAPRTRKAHVWPARHNASDLTSSTFPPMGQRFRLRADFDESGFDPQVRVILRALKKYGMILADNGSSWFLSGVPDERWDNDLLRQLRTLRGRDFEAVDTSSLMVDPDSARTSAGERTLFFPQVGNGSSASIRFQTTLSWVNLGDVGTVQVEFLTAEGLPWNIDLGQLGAGSTFTFNLQRGQSRTVTTSGLGPLAVGYVRMTASPGVEGTAIFSGSDAPRQTVLYEAGVEATDLGTDFSLALDTLGHRDTGLVLVHPESEGPAGAARVTLRLYTEAFELVSQRVLQLDPGQHLARFAFELFADPDQAALIQEMRGVLTVESDRPVAALALRQTDDPGREFPDEVPTLTTIPILKAKPD